MSAIASPGLASRLVNGVLAIKPLYAFAKHRARQMMIERAESLGVFWRDEVKALKARGGDTEFSAEWAKDLGAICNPDLVYPDYYIASFHAYEEGNLGWLPAMEVESAAYAVHARIWPDAGVKGDARLRRSYHEALKTQLPESPQAILDMGCGVGMSTFALQETFPTAQMTGVDLSPYFLAIAKYREQHRNTLPPIKWLHAPAEATGLPDASFDLVSVCLVVHELPQAAIVAILQEARRLLRPNGRLAIMDMNPKSEAYISMPPYILTLLKSTEPYLDQYFSLDIQQTFVEAGFNPPTLTCNSPRHRTILAQTQS